MLCESPALLVDLRCLLDERWLEASPNQGNPDDYVIERAFVEK